MKNRDIIEVMKSLEAIKGEKLPARLAWRVETARRALKPFHDSATEAVRLLKEDRSLKDKDGRPLEGRDGSRLFNRRDVEEINREIDSLLDEEVDVENVTIKLSDFPDDLEISPESIGGLGAVIEE